jgi:hypothetical protein
MMAYSFFDSQPSTTRESYARNRRDNGAPDEIGPIRHVYTYEG